MKFQLPLLGLGHVAYLLSHLESCTLNELEKSRTVDNKHECMKEQLTATKMQQ